MKKVIFKLLSVFISCILINTSKAQTEKSIINLPKIIKDPSSQELYSPESRKFTGIPSLAISNKGRLWAIWYGGITHEEDKNNYLILATSDDKGKVWKEVLAIDPDGLGPLRVFDAQVWFDPEGKLWLFWTQKSVVGPDTDSLKYEGDLWSMNTEGGDLLDPEWSVPKVLTKGIMMNKPTVLSSGEWLMPVSAYQKSKSVKVMVATDRGEKWEERASVNVPAPIRTPDEHMFIEKKDGSLWLLVRCKWGIGESFSYDKGRTWTDLTPSKIQHTPSRFFIRRLNSGNLLLVKHGPIEIRTGRSHLMAFVSKDDGLSWSKGLLLDEREWATYPDGQQANDGTIYVTYDYLRKKKELILMTSFTEGDILSSDHDAKIIEIFRRRRVISDGGEIEDSGPNPKPTVIK